MITQRLILDGGYPDGLWCCAGCAAKFLAGADGNGTYLAHRGDCPEMAAVLKAYTREQHEAAITALSLELLREQVAKIAGDAVAELTGGNLAGVGEAIRVSERDRIRAGLDAIATTLVRPGGGNGPAYQQALRVVPRAALEKLLDAGQ